MDEFTKKNLVPAHYIHTMCMIYIYILYIICIPLTSPLYLHKHHIILYYIIFTPPLYIPPLSPHFLKQAVIFEAPTQAIGRISQIKAGPLRGNMSWGLTNNNRDVNYRDTLW